MKRVAIKVILSPISIVSLLVIGYFISNIMQWVANIKLKLHPNLLELGFWEALFSGHFFSWLAKTNEQLLGTIGLMILAVFMIISIIIIWMWESDN